jgi:glycosyltransferase involved in cell wall biosynthesis
MSFALPTVAVIVPVYNGERTLAACLDSLLAQRYPAACYQVVVVENGSTDQTNAVAAQYADRVKVLHSEKRGPAMARNLGIACSQSEIVAFTDADCIAHPDWLINLLQHYANPQIVGVAGNIQAWKHADRNIVETFSDEHSPLRNFISGDHEFLPHLYTANASWRRSALEQVGSFDEVMFSGEDVELSWRVQLGTGLKVVYEPGAIIYHHHRSTWKGLGRQYRQYGFGEILLDTIFGAYPGYPRTRRFQCGRILGQCLALIRYLPSIPLRLYRYGRGRISAYDALKPWLAIYVELNNILGKLEAAIATRLMSDPHALRQSDIGKYINKYY